MPSKDVSSTLRVSLKEHFDTGLYSDLRIKDRNGHEYAVHRNIVCGQSPVLANACKTEHGFKEAQTGVIDLEHDDPDAVKAMLEFMYTGSYKTEGDEIGITQIARIYALGEMYCVSELKEVAATQFKELSSTCWSHFDFANAVKIIYESIPSGSGVCTIREMAVSVIVEHYIALLDKPEFQTILEDFGALGMDVLRVMASHKVEVPKKPKKYICPGSRKKKNHMVTPGYDLDKRSGYYCCEICGTDYSCYSFQLVEEN
ncbi:putative btb poz domain protein [Lasiodiplodia theobromae]|uniref:BTB/POZ domain containing protein n=1 Tax=Lasiodiplodia theobromae TaxID=45133 RepID=UPI0015C3CA64|nr:BTB/POZ domain containing protein [Lasiodiplodia theobromae]KAF4541493.1 BTB/POZ domain containing protein [Lasiodiplodia theobromae]KAF9640961.1 putative btb poz domain protein [Lasiodiplodia theobromae]